MEMYVYTMIREANNDDAKVGQKLLKKKTFGDGYLRYEITATHGRDIAHELVSVKLAEGQPPNAYHRLNEIKKPRTINWFYVEVEA
jgi:hypothetical protein